MVTGLTPRGQWRRGLRTDSAGGFRPARVNMSAELSPLDFATIGRFVPGAKLAGPESGTIRIAGAMRDVEVHAHLTAPGAPDSSGLAVDGHLDLASPVLGYDLAATARLLDAHSISTAAPIRRSPPRQAPRPRDQPGSDARRLRRGRAGIGLR